MPGILMVFVQDGCDACAEQKKVLKQLKTNITIQVIDCDARPAEADLWHVEATPTLIAVKDGGIVSRTSHYQSITKLKKILEKIA